MRGILFRLRCAAFLCSCSFHPSCCLGGSSLCLLFECERFVFGRRRALCAGVCACVCVGGVVKSSCPFVIPPTSSLPFPTPSCTNLSFLLPHAQISLPFPTPASKKTQNITNTPSTNIARNRPGAADPEGTARAGAVRAPGRDWERPESEEV